MSLKAKIEAVIYAAEEPATLAQLAAIFGAEVPFPIIHDASAAVEHEVTLIDDAGTMQDVEDASRPADESVPLLDLSEGSGGAAGTSIAAKAVTLPPDGLDPKVAEKRAARQRERDIREHLRSLIEELVSDYAVQDRGMEIREIAGGYRMATKPEYHDSVRAFVKSLKPVMKLSLQALETLAVIAYKQPVTSPEVSEIRGVDSGGVLASLISRKLVTTAGRKQVIGRPILYKTTKEFLLRFGLRDVAELPSMEEFEKMAVELQESEALEVAPGAETEGGLPFCDTQGDAGAETVSEAVGEHATTENGPEAVTEMKEN